MQGLTQKDQVSSLLQSKNSLLGQKKKQIKPWNEKKNSAKTCLILSHLVDSSASFAFVCLCLMYLSPQQSQTLFLSLYLSNNNNNDSLLLLFTYVEQKVTVVPNWVNCTKTVTTKILTNRREGIRTSPSNQV